MNPTIGTCGNCGGRVTIPELWGGSIPPPRTCESCGAKAKPNYGPRIDMDPSPQPSRFMPGQAPGGDGDA